MCGELRGASRREMHDFVLGKRITPSATGNVVEILSNGSPSPDDNDNLDGNNEDEVIEEGNKKPMPTKPPHYNDDSSTKENNHNRRPPPSLPKSTKAKTATSNPYFQKRMKSSSVVATATSSSNTAWNNAGGVNGSTANVATNNRIRNPYFVARQQQQSANNEQSGILQHNNSLATTSTSAINNPQYNSSSSTTQKQQQNQQQYLQPRNQQQRLNHQQQRQDQAALGDNFSAVSTGKNNVQNRKLTARTNGPIGTADDEQKPEPKQQPHPLFDKNSTKKKAGDRNKRRRDSMPIHRFGYAPGPVALDEETAATYIYPKHPDYPTRDYQLAMTETALNYNTLVSLPTGLGKTHIAAVVMYNYYRWFANGGGKIIFLAPTLPLVNQQVEACYKIVGMPGHDTAVMTGKIKAETRKGLWQTKRVFYCTPQTVQKDLINACGCSNNRDDAEEKGGDNKNNSIDNVDYETSRAFSKVVCLVLDEAHKATGDYAYTHVIELLEKGACAKFRIVGLSATPGTSIKAIQGVIETLRSVKIEARTDEDPTVAPYIHTKRVEFVICEQNNWQREIERMISAIVNPLLENLRERNVLHTYGNATLTSYSIFKAKETYIKNCGGSGSAHGGIVSIFLAAHTLVQLRNDCHQSLGVVKQKLLRLKNYPNRGAISTIVKSSEFDALLAKVIEVTGGGGAANGNSEVVRPAKMDPKLRKLCSLLEHHFEREKACHNSSRVIVFAQFRDSVNEIVKCLEHLKPLIRSRHFIGQNKGAGTTSKTTKKKKNARDENTNIKDHTDVLPSLDERLGGMKQAEQYKAIKDFRNNVFNVLVCTSIGEEGLDIGDVDLIINYDVLRSPIRTIQRAGRTGRKRDGRVVSLITEGQEEQTHKKRVAAEKTLMSALRNPKKFIMASHHPMLPVTPICEYQTMEIKSQLHMSQVVGAQQTPGTSKKKKEDKSAWRLNIQEEEERRRQFGDIIVALNEDVSWKRLRRFFCKNRIDPSRLPSTRNRSRQQLQRNQREEIIRRRQEVRKKLVQKGKSSGRHCRILEEMKRFGPLYSGGTTTRSGYRDILKIFPVDPDEEEDTSNNTMSKQNSFSGIKKNLWGGNNIQLSTTAPSEPESRPIASIGTVVGTSPAMNGPSVRDNSSEAGKVHAKDSSQAIMPDTEGAPAQNEPLVQKADRELRNDAMNTMLPNLGCEEVDSNANKARPQDQEASGHDFESGPTFQAQLPEGNDKVLFRLPTPPPSSASSSSEGEDENENAGESDVESIPQPAAFQETLPAHDREEEKIINAAPPMPEENYHNENIVFRLPTPPPSSSSSSEDNEEDGSSDCCNIEPIMQPVVVQKVPMQDEKKDQGQLENSSKTVQSIVIHGSKTNNESHFSDHPKGSNGEEKIAVQYIDVPAYDKPQEKISLGFENENDSALSSLKCKARIIKKEMGPHTDHGNDSVAGFPQISLSNKRKNRVKASKKSGNAKRDFPLLSLSNNKKKKTGPSKKSDETEMVHPRVSLGRNPNFANGNTKQSGKKRKILDAKEQIEEDTDSEDDIILASLKNKVARISNDISKEEESQIESKSQQIQEQDSTTQIKSKSQDHQNEALDQISQDIIINHRNASTKNKCKRILDTPESSIAHQKLDASTQNTSQDDTFEYGESGTNSKHFRIGHTCSKEENKVTGTSGDLNVDEPELSYQHMTPSIASSKPRSNALEDTPEICRKSVSNVLRDTPDIDTADTRMHNKHPRVGLLTNTPVNLSHVDEETACQVCTSFDSRNEDPIILCDGCNLGFHKLCYSIEVDTESEEPWFCDSCKYRLGTSTCSNMPIKNTCTYCRKTSGTLRKAENTWYHPLCSVFSSNISSTPCSACSLPGAVKCGKCSDAIHPYCAMAAGWTIVYAQSVKNHSKSSIFCPNHNSDITRSSGVRIIKKSFDECSSNHASGPKKLYKKNAKVKALKTDQGAKAAAGTSGEEEDFDEKAAKKERLERRRKGLARFVLEEAEIGSDDDGDEDEEEVVRRLEEDEEGYSQDSFINDNAVLTQHFSQDELGLVDPDVTDATQFDYGNAVGTDVNHNIHRVLDARRDRENQFKTPNFNRRMMRPDSSSQNVPSSERGLGKMHFIRSVLEHHRQGGDCNQIETVYNRLERGNEITSPPLVADETTTIPLSATATTRPLVDLTSPENENSPPSTDGCGKRNDNFCGNPMKNNGNENNSASVPFDTAANILSTNRYSSSSSAPSGADNTSTKGGGLTAEQKARIEANRQAALRRRAERTKGMMN